ncbi:MAG: hypothetical protein ABFS21_02325 [Actinomycetota bacterium]
MRFRSKLLLTIAAVFATVAVASNVFAVTRAHQERSRASETPLVFAPVPIPDPVETDPSSTSRSGFSEPSSVVPCGQRGACSDGPPDKELTNHGREVRAFIHEMGYAEGIDGPLGAIIRTIARPDGPPRSDRAQENLDNKPDKPNRPKDPPGQSRDR